jgi:hypothetical protein
MSPERAIAIDVDGGPNGDGSTEVVSSGASRGTAGRPARARDAYPET